MGFFPGEEVIVVENTGYRGSIIIKIKGTKLVLSSQIAERILLWRK
jgi:Fe2+ transport system protein FeoA